MNINTTIAKIANVIKKKLASRKTKKIMYSIDLHAEEDDNAANEAMEAQLMAFLASANPQPDQKTVTIVVPASPDHLRHTVRLTTGCQAAGPQRA